MCEYVGKADLLSDHFDGKQSWECVDLPLPCYPSPRLTSFTFRQNDVKRLLLDLDPYRALTYSVCFLFFLRELLIFWPLVIVCQYDGVGMAGFCPACFGGLFVWVVSWLAGDMQCHLYSKESTVLLCCQLPTISVTSVLSIRCLSPWCRFAADDLWNAVVCFQPPTFVRVAYMVKFF